MKNRIVLLIGLLMFALSVTLNVVMVDPEYHRGYSFRGRRVDGLVEVLDDYMDSPLYEPMYAIFDILDSLEERFLGVG